MRSLRRLSVVSIVFLSAIILGCTSIHAQIAATPLAKSATPQDASRFVTQIPPPVSSSQSAPQLPAPSTMLRLPPLSVNTIHRLQPDAIPTVQAVDAQQAVLLARNNGPCFTLRTYGFTIGRDPGEVPRLSNHTTCTPASNSHVKELVSTPSGPSR